MQNIFYNINETFILWNSFYCRKWIKVLHVSDIKTFLYSAYIFNLMTVIFFQRTISFPVNCCVIILLFLLLYSIAFLPVIISANHDEILSQALYFLLHFLFISIYRHILKPLQCYRGSCFTYTVTLTWSLLPKQLTFT